MDDGRPPAPPSGRRATRRGKLRRAAPKLSLEAAVALHAEIAAGFPPAPTAVTLLVEAAAEVGRGKGHPPGGRLLVMERVLRCRAAATALCERVTERAGAARAHEVAELLSHWAWKVADGMCARRAAKHARSSLDRRTKEWRCLAPLEGEQ